MSEIKIVSDEKERILKLIKEDPRWQETDEITGVDYAEEYRKQTGKDFATGECVVQ